MQKITFYPLGNADTSLIEYADDRFILLDYADNNPDFDLPSSLDEANTTDSYDVVSFSHSDADHIKGFSDYFYLEHAKKYQDGERKYITELWVPAYILLETSLTNEYAKILRAEARHRFDNNKGIRVFSNPDMLKDYCKARGIDFKSRQHLITNAGNVIPTFDLKTDGIEFFLHSPFSKEYEGATINRNDVSTVLHATFNNNVNTKMIFGADIKASIWKDIVKITKYYANEDRLEWDLFHVSHHSSYTALNEDKKGKSETVPIDEVKWLFETQGKEKGKIVSPSQAIPTEETTQPPHKQAAAYYKKVKNLKSGEFKVTMEHPTKENPKPMIFKIEDDNGITLVKEVVTGSAFIGSSTNKPPRNG